MTRCSAPEDIVQLMIVRGKELRCHNLPVFIVGFRENIRDVQRFAQDRKYPFLRRSPESWVSRHAISDAEHELVRICVCWDSSNFDLKDVVASYFSDDDEAGHNTDSEHSLPVGPVSICLQSNEHDSQPHASHGPF